MQARDIPAIGALARRIWHAHYPSIISREQIDYMLARGYSAESLQRQLDGGDRFLLAERGGEVAGFLSIGALAHMHDPIKRGTGLDVTDYFLHKFYLAPECWRQGVGGRLLNELLVQVPVRRLRLQVNRRNTSAVRFYRKHGFSIVQEHNFFLGHGYIMDDYIMEKWVP